MQNNPSSSDPSSRTHPSSLIPHPSSLIPHPSSLRRGKVFRIALAVAVIAVPVAAVLYCYAGPAYQRSRLLSEAQKALEADDLDQAEKLLGPLLRPESADYRSYLLYSKILRRRGRTQEALLSLGRATQLGLPEIEGRREHALVEAV